MEKSYKYIFFDLDGTLTDPEIGITKSVVYALKKIGILVEDPTTLRPFIGPPLRDSFQKFYGLTKEQCEQAITFYRERFSTTGLYENQIYPNIPELLDKLKESGKIIVLATSKPKDFALKILEHFKLIQYFDFIAGATLDGSLGEKDEIITYALNLCGNPELSQVIMIGDRCYDILGAKKNGIDSIGVLYGFGSIQELTESGATYLAKDVLDIFTLIK